MATQVLYGRRSIPCVGDTSSGSNRLWYHRYTKLFACQKVGSIDWDNRKFTCKALPPSLTTDTDLTSQTISDGPSEHNLLPLAQNVRMEASDSMSSSRLVSNEGRLRRDPRLLAALSVTLALVGEISYTWLSKQTALPSLADIIAGPLPSTLAFLICGFPVGIVAAKIALGDLFHVELHRGRLYICTGVPSSGPPLAAGAVVVRPTGDGRGNGAYAAALIPAGTHIADYAGELLDRAAFLARYPDSVGNYAMAIDDEWVIDAAAFAPCTSSFHAVHMNHSRTRANVRRYYKRSAGRVSFFAARDIQPGEELLYDYGRAYWYGREHLELP